MKTCLNTVCEKHGIRLERRGSHNVFCPACGEKTVLIGKVYLSIRSVAVICGTLIVIAFLTLLFSSVIPSCREAEAKKEIRRQQSLDNLSPEWRMIYASLKATATHSVEQKLVRSIKIHEMPNLTPEQLMLIKNVINCSGPGADFLLLINGLEDDEG